ncbi:MAG: TlpA family protein disulfide reductase [Saprospiraceae bacterium]|nr:TlpA family protein disulfide reductase [Saprospiraceae bacterium]MCB9326494.1 TlpA family protein disulfide reductase [Lewinellaceae bacterium]
MNTKLNKGLVAILIGSALGYFLYQLYHLDQQQPLINGEQAIDFRAENKDGTPLQLSSLHGKYVLLDFWASWCAPCRKNNPKIVQLYKTFHPAKFKDATGFEIVSIALEKTLDPWSGAIETDHLDWPYHVVDLPKGEGFDNGRIAERYNIKEIPATFLINPQGMIIGVDLSVKKMEGLLNSKLK